MAGLGGEGAEDGAEDGCIFWTDERSIRWSKDVEGFYGGAAGSLSYVSRVTSADEYGVFDEGGEGEEAWVAYDATSVGGVGVEEEGGAWGEYTFAARGGAGYRQADGKGVSDGGGDGAIYWRDEEGTVWCRDRYGVYGGGRGAEYHSVDGGSVWYGEGESWVEFTGDALEFIGATSVRKLRANSSRSTYSTYTSHSTSSSAYVVPTSSFKSRPPPAEQDGSSSAVDCGGVDDEEGGRGNGSHVWENERGVLQVPGSSSEDARYVELYGGGEAGGTAAERVKAEEARLNASFDRALRSAPAPMWPQMPLRL